MTTVRAYAVVMCVLVLAPVSRGSPAQLLQVFISLVEAASGQPRSGGTGCGSPRDQQVDAAVQEYLRMIMDLSEVAVVLDEDGHRPEAATERLEGPSEGPFDVDLVSRSMTNKMPNLKKCRPGHLPDRTGKCKKMLFDTKVWST